jgi:hypothetical protein
MRERRTLAEIKKALRRLGAERRASGARQFEVVPIVWRRGAERQVDAIKGEPDLGG